MARHPLQYFVREGHPERGGNEKNPNWILENMWRGERGKDSGEDHAAAIKQKRERFTLLRAVLLVIKQNRRKKEKQSTKRDYNVGYTCVTGYVTEGVAPYVCVVLPSSMSRLIRYFIKVEERVGEMQ